MSCATTRQGQDCAGHDAIMTAMSGTTKRHRSPGTRSLGLMLVVLGVLTAMIAVTALCLGAYGVPLRETLEILASRVLPVDETWSRMAQNVILEVRVPRVLGAMLVGSALAVAGCAYQGIFRNPLVSPDLLGVSGGACIGAALAILGGAARLGIQAAAFVGGVAAVLATMAIPRLLKRDSTVTLVLAGIIVGGFCGSILGIIKYLADPETELPTIVYWQMGSLAKVTNRSLIYVAPIILVALAGLIAMRWRVNLLSLGDHEAKALGVNLRLERGAVIAGATLLTASATCLAGTVGWVGLVVPHLARFVAGPNTGRSLPVACVMAAGFMVVVDTLARISGVEIPLGIITGLVGTPFFILLLARQKGVI